MHGDRLRCQSCGRFRSHFDAPGDTLPGLIAASGGIDKNREPFRIACPDCRAVTTGVLAP